MATYFRADAAAGTPPVVLSFDTVTTSPTLPYQYVGQIRSDTGVSTGFVVKKRVVATAGHVVFDDAKLTAAAPGAPTATADDLQPFGATGLQWLFQRDRGAYEPKAQTPRGFYALSGYAAQRIADGTAGQSSPASQNLDVAALYFLEDAGRGGFSGFLASDAADNEFLLSSAPKTLVGYPVDTAISVENRGRMHATPPANVAFSRVPGEAQPAFPFRTYTTSDITSYGGNSGGPLCVQAQGGSYYPAAIYLGGSAQTVVRAIDSQVADLFGRAEVSGDGGQNNTGGGITQVNSPLGATAFSVATLNVTIEPAPARAAAAKWGLKGGSLSNSSGTTKTGLLGGSYILQFSTVPGFQVPTQPSVVLTEGFEKDVIFTYVPALPPVVTGPRQVLAARGQPFSFTIQAANGATSFSVSGLTGTGLVLTNASQGIVSGTPTVNGDYSLSVIAQNPTGPSAAFTIDFMVADPGQLTVQADPIRGSVGVAPKRALNVFAIGENVTLTAKPASGFVFAGWTFDGLPDGAAKYPSPLVTTFPMAMNVSATANFIANPFVALTGSYTGRFAPATDVVLASTGRLQLQVAKLGSFSGKLLLGAKSFTVKGRFLLDGTAAPISIKRPGAGDLVLTLKLDPGSETIAGDLNVGVGAPLALTLVRAVYDGKKLRAPETGSYTAVLQRPGPVSGLALPEGDGFATVSLQPNGKVKMVGHLGDGTAFSESGAIARNGAWPFHLLLYKSAGVLTGDLAFTSPGGVTQLDGTLDWVKPPLKGANVTYPAGFTARSVVHGVGYDAKAALLFSSASLSFGGGGVDAPPIAELSVNSAKRFTQLSGPPLVFRFVGKSGLFSGQLSESGEEPRSFSGAFVGGTGYGWSLGASLPGGGRQTGFVHLDGH